MNHSLQATIASVISPAEMQQQLLKVGTYCAMVPEGLRPCLRARCTCVAISAAIGKVQKPEVEPTLLVPRTFLFPRRSFATCAS